MTAINGVFYLYGTTSRGQKKVWIGRLLRESELESYGVPAGYEIQYGLLGGKLQTTTRFVNSGKNIGRANETTPTQQAAAELNRLYLNKKEKEGYQEAVASAAAAPAPSKTVYPMLAQTHSGTTAARMKFPCFVQPKLDGLRCVMYLGAAGIVAQSRTGGEFVSVAHIKDALAQFFKENPAAVLDGELYTTAIPFEQIAGLVKSKKLTADKLAELQKVEYHIYDLVEPDAPFAERTAKLAAAAATLPPPIRLVLTARAETPDHMKDYFRDFVAEGYEGIMLRNAAGLYKVGGRSADLQKYKEFQEEEFKIVDVTQGEGRDEGTAIFQCATAAGGTFWVRPRGTVEYRRELFAARDEYIGGQLTVIFQEYSDHGIPRFPVGKIVRQNAAGASLTD